MGRLLLRRLATGLPTLLVLVTLTFFLMRAAPGGPFDRERRSPPAVAAALAATYHLDEPLPRQYARYLAGLARGDLGPSFQYPGYRVDELIRQGLPASALLGGLALLLGVGLGVAAGVGAALWRGRPADALLTGLAMVGISVPGFVVAPLLILAFAVHGGWLPAGGWTPGDARDLVLPVVALALPLVATVARLTRGSLLDTLGQPFVRTARAKGLPPATVVLRHALKPALLPVLSYLGPAAAGVLTGSVVIEQVFGIPGVGRYFVQGALNRDYTLVLGVVLLYGLLILLGNLLADLGYGWLDPRVRAS